MPDFESHKEARAYFKELFGGRIALQMSEVIGDRKWYFYHYVMDKPVYLSCVEKMKNNEPFDALEFMNSYQEVQVCENGDVHIVY